MRENINDNSLSSEEMLENKKKRNENNNNKLNNKRKKEINENKKNISSNSNEEVNNNNKNISSSESNNENNIINNNNNNELNNIKKITETNSKVDINYNANILFYIKMIRLFLILNIFIILILTPIFCLFFRFCYFDGIEIKWYLSYLIFINFFLNTFYSILEYYIIDRMNFYKSELISYKYFNFILGFGLLLLAIIIWATLNSTTNYLELYNRWNLIEKYTFNNQLTTFQSKYYSNLIIVSIYFLCLAIIQIIIGFLFLIFNLKCINNINLKHHNQNTKYKNLMLNNYKKKKDKIKNRKIKFKKELVKSNNNN